MADGKVVVAELEDLIGKDEAAELIELLREAKAYGYCVVKILFEGQKVTGYRFEKMIKTHHK